MKKLMVSLFVMLAGTCTIASAVARDQLLLTSGRIDQLGHGDNLVLATNPIPFKNQELEELNDIDGRGRKPALDIEKDSKEVKEYMKVHNIRETCAILNEKKRDKKVSPQRFKRFLKKMA